MKNNQTRHPGAQNPQPGPLPTGPYKQTHHDTSHRVYQTLPYLNRSVRLNICAGHNPEACTHGVEAVVDEMLQVLAHADLSHQLVLVAVHARQLAHMGEDILQAVRQLQIRHDNEYVQREP